MPYIIANTTGIINQTIFQSATHAIGHSHQLCGGGGGRGGGTLDFFSVKQHENEMWISGSSSEQLSVYFKKREIKFGKE